MIYDRYIEAEKAIIMRILERMKAFLSDIRTLSFLMSELDCIMSFAEVSHQLSWTAPTMLPRGSKNMKLLRVRDPVAEARIGVADYVPSDYDMNGGFETVEYADGACVLSGPNMGGLCLDVFKNCFDTGF